MHPWPANSPLREESCNATRASRCGLCICKLTAQTVLPAWDTITPNQIVGRHSLNSPVKDSTSVIGIVCNLSTPSSLHRRLAAKQAESTKQTGSTRHVSSTRSCIFPSLHGFPSPRQRTTSAHLSSQERGSSSRSAEASCQHRASAPAQPPAPTASSPRHHTPHPAP